MPKTTKGVQAAGIDAGGLFYVVKSIHPSLFLVHVRKGARRPSNIQKGLRGDGMDKDYFVQELEAHSDMMYRVAFTILHNDDACKDALQEAALKAWEKRATLRNAQFFVTWVTRILINVCHTFQRKQRRLTPLIYVPEPAAQAPDPALALALHALPEKLRLPLVLRYAEGMDEAEIAQTLRLPASTVRGRLYRAKIQLGKELEV
jgi:RNA polymerase sigma-70 factor, ECF subfamily